MHELLSCQRLIRMIGVTVLTLGLASCDVLRWYNGPEPEMSVLTGQPCAPPCWQGITPGITTEQQALDILHDSPITKNATIEEEPTERIVSSAGTRKMFRVGADEINLYTRNNLVELIQVKPLFRLTLGQIVARYGKPEKFAALFAPIGHLDWQFEVFMLYPQSGLVTFLHTSPRKTPNNQFIVADDMQVTNLYYFPSGSIEDVFKIARDRIAGDWLSGTRYLQEWKGFGPIDSVSTPPFLP